MILIHEAERYRVCLECHARLETGDERRWMQQHLRCPPEREWTAPRNMPPDAPIPGRDLRGTTDRVWGRCGARGSRNGSW